MGLLIGMVIGDVIALILSYISHDEMIMGQSMVDRFGSQAGALLMQTIFSGIYGAISMAGVSFYEIDDWGLLKTAVVHCLTIEIAFVLIGLYMEWLRPDLAEILICCLISALIYMIIWLIMNARYKAEVNGLNRLLNEKGEDNEE